LYSFHASPFGLRLALRGLSEVTNMAYIIKNLEGETLAGGLTRQHVIRVLIETGLISHPDQFTEKLPRFGRQLSIIRPLSSPYDSFYVEHI